MYIYNCSELKIRNVEESDLDAIDHLIRQAVAGIEEISQNQRDIFINNALENTKWAMLNKQSSIHLIAKSEAKVIGVVLIKNFWNLCSLFVLPDFQRRGVGNILVNEAIQKSWAYGTAPTIRLRTLASKKPFYARIGFISSEKLDDHGTSEMAIRRPSENS